MRSIAFPAISCGVYGYPLDLAVQIAVRECADFTAVNPLPQKIVFACFGDTVLTAYEAELAKL
ncbi:O-acetyl-ADP-ribose deacetylase [compost metagenome]